MLLHLWEGELHLLMTRGLALQQKIALSVLIAGWSYALLLTHNLEAFLVVISLPSIPQKCCSDRKLKKAMGKSTQWMEGGIMFDVLAISLSGALSLFRFGCFPILMPV